MTYSYTTTDAFTRTHARRLAAKVIADMHQCRRLYGEPSATLIDMYNEELVVLLAEGYLATYEFGFQTGSEERVVSWRYRVTAAGELEGGRAGGLYAVADVSTANFFNYLTHTKDWWDLASAQRAAINDEHEITRTVGDPPSDGSGRWVRDRTYVSGGVAVEREEFRPW